eukprot:11014762-Alexandrium_andersonii.AAC.1
MGIGEHQSAQSRVGRKPRNADENESAKVGRGPAGPEGAIRAPRRPRLLHAYLHFNCRRAPC